MLKVRLHWHFIVINKSFFIQWAWGSSCFSAQLKIFWHVPGHVSDGLLCLLSLCHGGCSPCSCWSACGTAPSAHWELSYCINLKFSASCLLPARRLKMHLISSKLGSKTWTGCHSAHTLNTPTRESVECTYQPLYGSCTTELQVEVCIFAQSKVSPSSSRCISQLIHSNFSHLTLVRLKPLLKQWVQWTAWWIKELVTKATRYTSILIW